jgi:hypothetical protein
MSDLMKFVNWMVTTPDVKPLKLQTSVSPLPSWTGKLNVHLEPTIVDLPRFCSFFNDNRLYMSRFLEGDGPHRWQYSGPVSPTDIVKSRLYGAFGRPVELCLDGVEEKCPHCGALGIPIRCGTCLKWICTGRTTADGYFRCRPSCQGEGRVTPARIVDKGIGL